MTERTQGVAAEVLLYLCAGLLFLLGYGFSFDSSSRFVPGPRDQTVLRVATWNVGGFDDGRPHALRVEDVEAVARTLLELDPDLVFLQEVGGRERYSYLLRSLGAGWDGVQSGGGDLAAFARRGDLERFDVRSPSTRVLGVHLRSRLGVVSAVGVHAHAFSSRRRNLVVGSALDSLREEARSSALVFAGDLNLDLDLDKHRDLFSDDAHRDVETYNYVAERLLDAARGAGPTAEPDRRLDYVFVSEDAFEVVQAGPWKGRRVGSMDHDRVVVDLRAR
ncbi:MAG: endonuclease/exonuclease/phosphatase family protein [Planctomycetota bacterium]|nr:endonuclease/exonuclease/phosphatase family protein [Planctomycetota bacterium]